MRPKREETDGMSLLEANRLFELSKRAHWAFPSSFGRPVRWNNLERWVEELDKKRGPFVRAVTFLMNNGQEDKAVELAARVWRLWILARDDGGGRRLLAKVLDKGSRKPSKARALALYGDSLLAMRQGKTDESKKSSTEALKVAKKVGDSEALTLANLALSRVAFERGDYQESLSRAKDARRLARVLDPAFGQAPLFMEAQSYRMLGDYDRASSLFGQSVELNKRIGDKGMVIAELNNLGLVEIHRNNVHVAERLLVESEKISGTKGNNPYGEGMSFLNEAMVAFRKGEIPQARSLLLKAKSAFLRTKVELARDDKSELDWLDQELSQISG